MKACFPRRRFLAASLAAIAGAASGQAFPSKPVRIIVPYAPGGIVDQVARTVAPHLAARLKQPVVVENKPGAAGGVAMETLKHSPADGHTLVLADPALVINPVIQPQLPYRASRDLQPVSLFAQTGLILAVHPSVPASDVQGLVRHLRASPGQNFSSPGVGTVPHMAGELFKARAGLNLTHIPYKGGNAALADVLTGRIQMVFFTPTVVLPHIREGRMRALAYTGSSRSLVAPDLPTMKEAGMPDFEANVWLMFAAHSGTPRQLVIQLNHALVDISKMTEVRTALSQSDVNTIASTPEQAAQLVHSEEARWAAVVKANQIRPEQ